ncbi:MAG: hypothetical protein DSM106950_02725 [Stigonema ocellatum SAG 48.90 = DSM 106950]|nr:hypothetical protein [Stigonema ocellatum SAG 48.90 = DSM 106950]
MKPLPQAILKPSQSSRAQQPPETASKQAWLETIATPVTFDSIELVEI